MLGPHYTPEQNVLVAEPVSYVGLHVHVGADTLSILVVRLKLGSSTSAVPKDVFEFEAFLFVLPASIFPSKIKKIHFFNHFKPQNCLIMFQINV